MCKKPLINLNSMEFDRNQYSWKIHLEEISSSEILFKFTLVISITHMVFQVLMFTKVITASIKFHHWCAHLFFLWEKNISEFSLEYCNICIHLNKCKEKWNRKQLSTWTQQPLTTPCDFHLCWNWDWHLSVFLSYFNL